jgi:acyl carrier protein
MADVRKQVADVFANTLQIDPSVLNGNSNPETIEQWDSLAHVQLILALEKSFGITITPETAMEFETFDAICEFIEETVN